MLISRLPPPRSTMQRGTASGPRAANTASLPRRDSSDGLITSRAIPDFLFMARTNASWFRASRVALVRSEEHTSELQSRLHLVCRLLLEKKKYHHQQAHMY